MRRLGCMGGTCSCRCSCCCRRGRCRRCEDMLWCGWLCCMEMLFVCAKDVELLEMLSVPLVAPHPSHAASVGTKLRSKRIFAAPDVNAFPSIDDLFDPSLQIWRSPQPRGVVVKLNDEVTGRGIAMCEVGEIVEKGLDAAGLKMEDVVLSIAALIELAVLKE